MSKKKYHNLSSEEAALTFKNKIDNCLGLLGFLNSKDKEDLWKFWKTVSSAVKIAVNGKGDIISSPQKCPKHNGRKDREKDEEEVLRLKNLARKAITIYVPLSCADRGYKRYHVFKFVDEEKIEDYIEEVIASDELGETDKNHATIIENVEFSNTEPEMAISPDKIIAQISQLRAENSIDKDEIAGVEICDNAVSNFAICSSLVTNPSVSNCTASIPDSNDLGLSRDQEGSVEETQFSSCNPSKHKVEMKTYAVRKPTTRLSSRVKERNSVLNIIPVRMRAGKVGKRDKIVEPEVDVSITNPSVNSVLSSENSGEDPNSVTVIQLPSDKILNFSKEEKESDMTVNYNEILSGNVIEVTEKVKTSEATDDVLNGTLTKTEFGPQILFPVTDTSYTETVVVKSEVLDKDVENENVVLEGTQQINAQDQLPNRSSSDIETIISALEEELKKSGSGVHSISLTSVKDSQDIHSPKEEVVDILPSQEIVAVQSVEDVIWNPDGSVQVMGTHSLIDTAQALPPVNEEGVMIQPIDAQYDVVEYEVLAEKCKSRNVGSKKRKRDKELANEDKETLDRTCPMCHRVLTYPSSMAAHMRIHTGDRPYSCGQCHRKFTTKANRDRHEATHVGLKPFKCTECDKCFTEKRSLKIHMRSHTGERPFVCTVCNRGFAQKCTLMVHMDRHTNRKGHLCDLCGKAFRQKCQLDIHVKRHNRQANYPCPECSVKCYTKGDLMRHMIKHTGERPFQCSSCPRTFTRKQYLMDHENTHFGRKPYKCSICSMAFHDMGSCHRHLRKHRGEEEAGKGQNATKAATILTADDYDTIVNDSQTGKILTLEDGTQALVTAVDTEADGSTVYHITCVGNQHEKIEETDIGKTESASTPLEGTSVVELSIKDKEEK